MVSLTISLEFLTNLLFVDNEVLYFCTLQTMFTSHPWFPLPPLFSLKIKTGTSHNIVFWMEASVCRDGTLKNQPNKMGMTPQHFHTISTSCATVHTPKPSTCTLDYSQAVNQCITTYQQSTQHCSLHSLLHIRQPISAMSAMLSSN